MRSPANCDHPLCLCEPQLEAIDLVERAFVHVDYQHREEPEHRTERCVTRGPVTALFLSVVESVSVICERYE